MIRLSEKLDINTGYSPRSADGWHNVGAGGGGALFHPKVSPHDKDLWMICCDMSNTYITHDAGKHWKMLHLNNMVKDIAFDPVNPNVIYAGSQALYRSDDKGHTWRLVLPTPTDDKGNLITITPETVVGRMKKIHVDHKNSDCVYVGFHTERFQRTNPDSGCLKVYASYDGTVSWTDLGDLEGSEIIGIDVAETGSERIPVVFTNAGYYKYDGNSFIKQPLPEGLTLPLTLAKAGIHPGTGKTVFYISTNLRVDADGGVHSGIFRSFDQGQTWDELQGFDVDFPDKKSKRFIKEISVSYNNPARIYASVMRNPLVLPSCNVPGAPYEPEWRHPYMAPGAQGESIGPVNRMGVMVSDDYGETWHWSMKMDLDLPDNVTVGWYENAYDVDWLGPPWYMDVNEHDSNHVLAALQGFAWVTHNGGKTWEQVYTEQYEDGSWYGKGFESTTCYDVVFDPFNKDNLIITYTDNGMLKSTNGGKTWHHSIKGVPYDWINTCYKMVFDPEVPGLAWGVWTSIHDLPDHFMRRLHIAKIPPHAKGGVCITEDSASSWRNLTDLYEKGYIYTCIALDPGRTGEQFRDGGAASHASPIRNRTLYVSRCPDGVLKSTDGGKTWENKSVGFGINKNVFYLHLTPDGKLYAVTMKTLTDNDTPDDIRKAMWQGGVYVSGDGAETWREMPLPKGVENPQKIAINPGNPNHIYLTAHPYNAKDGILGGYRVQEKANLIGGGVYESKDGGETWQNIFDDRVMVSGIQIDPDNPLAIYIVTIEYAAYRSMDGGKTWERIRGYHFLHGKNPILDPYNKDMMYITTFGGSVFYGPRAGGAERYDDIDGFTLEHRV